MNLVIDQSLVGVPIAYRLAQLGAAEFFVDGKLIHTGGRVGHSSREEELYLQKRPFPRLLVLEDTVAWFWPGTSRGHDCSGTTQFCRPGRS